MPGSASTMTSTIPAMDSVWGSTTNGPGTIPDTAMAPAGMIPTGGGAALRILTTQDGGQAPYLDIAHPCTTGRDTGEEAGI